MASAREEAIDAGALALWTRDGWLADDYPDKALIHQVSVATALDAIPDDVLVRLLFERGALIDRRPADATDIYFPCVGSVHADDR